MAFGRSIPLTPSPLAGEGGVGGVPETQRSVAVSREPFVSGSVGRNVNRVLSAIEFHDQSSREADEVCDVRSDGNLAPEAKAELVAAKPSPQQALAARHRRAKLPRMLSCPHSDSTLVDHRNVCAGRGFRPTPHPALPRKGGGSQSDRLPWAPCMLCLGP